jgi:ribosomal protein L7Ae-like RNA K-turn-binding protein
MPGRADPLALLGLARRAGKVLQGTDAVRRAVRSGEAALVLLAGDASPVQLEKVRRLLRHHEVPHAVVADRNRLGAALGAGPLSAVAVTDPSLADQLRRRLPATAGGRRSSPDGGTPRNAGS